MARHDRALPPHLCPCGCGDQVPHHLLTCQVGWRRLPMEIRNRINAAYRRDPDAHAAAVADAYEWYRENPREQVQQR